MSTATQRTTAARGVAAGVETEWRKRIERVITSARTVNGVPIYWLDFNHAHEVGEALLGGWRFSDGKILWLSVTADSQPIVHVGFRLNDWIDLSEGWEERLIEKLAEATPLRHKTGG